MQVTDFVRRRRRGGRGGRVYVITIIKYGVARGKGHEGVRTTGTSGKKEGKGVKRCKNGYQPEMDTSSLTDYKPQRNKLHTNFSPIHSDQLQINTFMTFSGYQSFFTSFWWFSLTRIATLPRMPSNLNLIWTIQLHMLPSSLKNFCAAVCGRYYAQLV
jgi:hypothetical protein